MWEVGWRRAGLTRDACLAAMTARNIGVGVHYLCLAEHPYYHAKFGWRPEDYPHATAIGRATISLPLSAALSDQDAADVVEAVRKAFG